MATAYIFNSRIIWSCMSLWNKQTGTTVKINPIKKKKNTTTKRDIVTSKSINAFPVIYCRKMSRYLRSSALLKKAPNIVCIFVSKSEGQSLAWWKWNEKLHFPLHLQTFCLLNQRKKAQIWSCMWVYIWTLLWYFIYCIQYMAVARWLLFVIRLT